MYHMFLIILLNLQGQEITEIMINVSNLIII